MPLKKRKFKKSKKRAMRLKKLSVDDRTTTIPSIANAATTFHGPNGIFGGAQAIKKGLINGEDGYSGVSYGKTNITSATIPSEW